MSQELPEPPVDVWRYFQLNAATCSGPLPPVPDWEQLVEPDGRLQGDGVKAAFQENVSSATGLLSNYAKATLPDVGATNIWETMIDRVNWSSVDDLEVCTVALVRHYRNDR